MIKQILKIKGVGKYLDFHANNFPSATWNKELAKITLIYGDNGIGKTTLALIFNSLKGDNQLLAKKRAFGFLEEQEIELIFEGKKISFNSSDGWNEKIEDIEVFDANFISENIFAGAEIQNSHKKNLFEVIIGQQGIRLKEEISNIKYKAADLGKELSQIENNIVIATNNLVKKNEVEYFIKQKRDSYIEERIKEKELEIQKNQNEVLIKSKNSFQLLSPIILDFDEVKIKHLFNSSLKSISSNYLQKVAQHKEHLGLNKEPEKWIKQGLEMLKDDLCPFCSQKIDSTVDIIQAYHQYFNEEYTKLQQAVLSFKTSFENLSLIDIFSKIDATLNDNLNTKDFWDNYLKKINLPIFETSKMKREMESSIREIRKLIDLKLANITQAIEETNTDRFFEILKVVSKQMEVYNNEISQYNADIQIIKNEIGKKDLLTLNKELEKLKIIKSRDTSIIDNLCNNYFDMEAERKSLKKESAAKQKQLDKYTNDTFKKYAESINGYLKKFAPYIEIKNLQHAYRGSSKEPYVEYALFVANNKISFLENDNHSYSMKYVLSEGDKSALALAFFFARLATDTNNLKNKIIVFDDPISSFDLNRRNITLQSLYKLGEKSKQLILLTHNQLFARKFYDIHKQHCLPLRINYQNNSSYITTFDIELETSTEELRG